MGIRTTSSDTEKPQERCVGGEGVHLLPPPPEDVFSLATHCAPPPPSNEGQTPHLAFMTLPHSAGRPCCTSRGLFLSRSVSEKQVFVTTCGPGFVELEAHHTRPEGGSQKG